MKVIPKSIHHLLDDSKGGIKKSYLEENYYDKDYIDDNFVSEADVSNFVTIQGPLQTVLGEKKLKNISLLNIPGTAPSSSDIDTGKSYLYSSYGSYAEVPGGGGGGGGETLTVTKNGSAWLSYNGSQAVSLNLAIPTTVASLSDASDYATKTWVENKGYITSAALSGYVTIATDQEITGAKYFSNALAIPLSAPSSPTSGLSYLYAGSGSYAEEPGGGVADVYPLTITKNGSSWLYYDPGEEAVSVNLSVPTKVSDLTNDTGFITSSALTGYATQTWVENKGYITSSALTGYVNDFEVTGSGNAVTTGSKSGSKITLTKDNTFVDLTSTQKITGAKKHANVALLNIPTSISSSDIESGKVYLYSGSGEYAEEASGGVADVYPLYLVIGGTTTTYDPASESTTVTFGSAAKKGYTTNITQGSADLPTSGAVYSAIAAAVTSALHYRGMSSTALTDGGTETAIIGGVALVPQSGDVVIYGGFEFLWENSVWNKLGDDSSYALKTIQISAGTGLSGGGDLTSSRTISLSSATIASLGLADSALQSSDMKALTLKVGTATIGSDYNALAAKTYTISKTNITDTIGSTTYAPYHADGYLPLSAGSGKALTGDLYFTKTIYGADVQVGRIGSVIDGGIVTYFTNPSSGSGSGTGPGFAIINTPYERLLFWLGSTDDSLEIYHEGNLTKGVLTTLLESNNGYYVKKSGDTMTGTLNSQSIIPTSNTSYDLGSSASKWNNIYTRALYAAVAKISDLLSIPTVAPASGSVVSGEAYLYSSTGSYAETPGGGVADVYPLTITKNGSAWLYYNPGTQSESINLAIPTKVSDLTNDTGFITASSIPSTYAWSAITNTPTTLSGYGITDAKIETPSGTTNKKITLGSNNFTIYSWALASAKPSYTLDEVADGSTRKLANYLPLTGGVVTGNVFLKGSANLVTNSTGNYANGIRINRASTSTWAGMTIGYVSSDQAGGGTGYDSHTWMIATPGTSDYLNISYNGNTSTTIGLTLKGNGVNDLLWNNNKVWHEGNLTKSVLTTLLDSNSGYYLPLAGGTMTGAIVPNAANTIDFGTSTYYWKEVHSASANLYGNLAFNAPSAGNVITWINSSNVRQEALSMRSNGHLVLGANQITNSKDTYVYGTNIYVTWKSTRQIHFTGDTIIPNSSNAIDLGASSNYWKGVYTGALSVNGNLTFDASSHRYIKYIDNASTPVTHNAITMYNNGGLVLGEGNRALGNTTYVEGGNIQLIFNNSEDRRIIIGSNYMRPDVDNQLILGTSSYRWNTVYAAAVSASTYYGTLYDFVYLTNHPYNVDDAAAKGVNFHYANAGTKPTGSQDGSAFTLAWSSAWVTQMYGDWRTNKFYTRVKTNGTWGDWAELATTKGTVEGLNTSTESDATFTYRAVPSVAVGDVARVTKVKGKTIVWNQKVTNGDFALNSDWAGLSGTVSISSGVGTYTITTVQPDFYSNQMRQGIANCINGHKYYYGIDCKASKAMFLGGLLFGARDITPSATAFTRFSGVTTYTGATGAHYLYMCFGSGATRVVGDSFDVRNIFLCDLTLMFGAGNEPTSVAEFEALYPGVFYSYNTGELVSNKAESIETIGFNLWDEDTMFLGVSGVTRTSDGWVATSANIAGHGHYWENTIGYTGQMCIYMKALANSSSGNFRFTFAYTDGTSSSGPVLSGTSIDEYVLSTSGKVVSNIRADYSSNRTITLQKLCLSFYDASRNGQYEPYEKDNLPLNITKLKVDTTNLWDEQWEQGTLDTNGADYASTINIRNKGYIPVEGGKTYYVKGNIQVYEYGASKNYITRTFLNSGTITLNVNTCYLRWRSADNYTYTEGDIWINTPNKRPPLKLNQMFENGDFSNGTTGWGYYNSSISAQNGALSVQVTQANGGFTTTSDKNPTLIGGHKYFIQYAFNSPSATSTFVYFNGNSFIAGKYVKAGYNVYAGIGTISTTATGPVIARFNATGTYTVYSIVLIDLTKMYGQGLEPTDTEIVSERIGLYRPYTTGEYMPYYAFPKGMRCADYACSVCDEVIGKQAIVKVGAVDLGLMAWTRDSSGIFYTGSVPGSVSRTSGTTHMILPKYNQKNASSSIGGASSNGDYCQAGARIAIYDTGYSDAVSFQRSLNSVKLYFELSTPIIYDLETAVPELIECDVLGTQRRLPEDTASSVQAPFHCDFQYGANPGEIVSDSAYRYLPLAGGTVTGTLECKGELVVPDHAPYQPEPNKHYLYVNDNGNYYQS